MLVTAISDTHCQFPDLPGGDLLIHAGDFSHRGRPQEVDDNLIYFVEALAKYKYVVFICGNHEVGLERADQRGLYLNKTLNKHKDRLFYLHESEITLDGFKFYGAPHTPYFGGWAWNVLRGNLHTHWEKIPTDTDVLITHGPPYGYGDFVPRREWSALAKYYVNEYERVGDSELLYALEKIKPQYHIFGHIHEGYGKYEGKEKDNVEGVMFINASQVNESYKLVNKPIQFVLEKPKTSV